MSARKAAVTGLTRMVGMAGIKRHLQVIRSVASVTFSEIIRDKVLYNAIVLSVLLFLVALLAARLSILQPGRMLLDFGMSALLISTSLTAILLSSGMISKEIVNRTMSVCLSHPIHRIQFVWGKYIGLAQVLLINWAILCTVFCFMIWLFIDTSIFSEVLGWSLVLSLIQCLVLAAVALFFSSFSTTSLAVVCGLGVALIGSNMSQLRLLADRVRNDFASGSLRFFTWILPDIEVFHLKLQLTYSLPIPFLQIVMLTLVGFIWILILVSLSGFLVSVRES